MQKVKAIDKQTGQIVTVQIEENCTISFQGKEFTSGGAFISEKYIIWNMLCFYVYQPCCRCRSGSYVLNHGLQGKIISEKLDQLQVQDIWFRNYSLPW